MAIESNLNRSAHPTGVRQLMSLCSRYIYPRDNAPPIEEEYLLTSPMHATNEPCAVTKVAGVRLCERYRRQ